jgi:hypothetical protein
MTSPASDPVPVRAGDRSEGGFDLHLVRPVKLLDLLQGPSPR